MTRREPAPGADPDAEALGGAANLLMRKIGSAVGARMRNLVAVDPKLRETYLARNGEQVIAATVVEIAKTVKSDSEITPQVIDTAVRKVLGAPGTPQ